jgi:hypothetical protein
LEGGEVRDDEKLTRLHRRLVEVLGEEEADTLMELLLPARWDLIALRNGIARPAPT